MNKKLVVLLLLCPIVLLIVVIGIRRVKPVAPAPMALGAKPSTEANPTYKRLIAEWSAATYVPLEEILQGVGNGLEGIQFEKRNVELSSAQESQLRESVRALLLAFHSGQFEDYLKFRTPVSDFNYNPLAINYFTKEIKTRYSKSDEELPKNPPDVFKLYWSRCYGGNAFVNYWKGISKEKSHVVVEKGDAMPEKLSVYALSVGNAGVVSCPPTFKFEATPESILKRDGELISATVSLMIQSRPPEPPHPVHCRFYWTTGAQKWLPMELVSCYLGLREAQPVF